MIETAGTVENITRLAGENGDCAPAFGFVQDGVPVRADAHLETLGRLPQAESLLLLSRHSFDGDGTPVEWAQSRYRGDRYKLVTRLHRGSRGTGRE